MNLANAHEGHPCTGIRCAAEWRNFCPLYLMLTPNPVQSCWKNPAARNSRKMKHNDCKIGAKQCFAMSLGSFAIVPPALCSARPASIHQHLPHPIRHCCYSGVVSRESRLLALGSREVWLNKRSLPLRLHQPSAGNPNESSIAATKPPGRISSFHRTLSADKLEALFNHVDKNHDGVLNVREMILGLRREPELAKLLDLQYVLIMIAPPPPTQFTTYASNPISKLDQDSLVFVLTLMLLKIHILYISSGHIHQEDGTREAFERIFRNGPR